MLSGVSAVPEQYRPGRAPFRHVRHPERVPFVAYRHNYAVNRENEKKNAYAERPELQQWGDKGKH